jgi:hypothetical protein
MRTPRRTSQNLPLSGDWVEVLNGRELLSSEKVVNYELALEILRESWEQNPFTKNPSGYYRLGQWFAVQLLLRRSHLTVHFAGEHLNEDWQGFIEGCRAKGRRCGHAHLMTTH